MHWELKSLMFCVKPYTNMYVCKHACMCTSWGVIHSHTYIQSITHYSPLLTRLFYVVTHCWSQCAFSHCCSFQAMPSHWLSGQANVSPKWSASLLLGHPSTAEQTGATWDRLFCSRMYGKVKNLQNTQHRLRIKIWIL